MAIQRETAPTIRFTSEWSGSDSLWSLLPLPRHASAQLPAQTHSEVEGTVHGLPFRAAVERRSSGACLKVPKVVLEATGTRAGTSVHVEITRVGEEPETRVPSDLSEALAACVSARTAWGDITPAARRDWILWIISARQAETRKTRIEKASDMLSAGKRRVCCFGGLSWLTKDYAKSGETWRPLPKVA